MYRALTASINKKSAFVVDLNPVRTLAATYAYTRAAFESAVTQSSILDIIYDVYSWDNDYFEYNIQKGTNSRILSAQERLRELLEESSKDEEYKIFNDITNSEKKLAINIKKKIGETGITDILKDIIIPKLSSSDGKIIYKEKADIVLKHGQLVIKLKRDKIVNDNENDDKKYDDEEEDIEEILIQNFTEAIMDFIKYLAITSSASTFDEALIEFEMKNMNNEDTTLQSNVFSLLKQRGAIIDHKIISPETIMTIFLTVIKEYSPGSSREIFRQMKSKINEPSTRKNEVLKIIHRHLTPRKAQKKDFGEVFTPIELIEDMVEHLPKSDWENPNLTWLDPANGIGNFPITLFYKLDKGLSKWQPNTQKRRKHIIENMLFMMELQSNNNRIAKNIFKKLCDDCEPNIWTVNSLQKSNDEILEHFGIKQIDRIIGNPPFQAYQESDGKRGGGDELYMKFVRKSIELLTPNGYLVFVHPSSWRKPEFIEGRKVSKNAGMFELMAHENQLHYLEIHDSKDGQKVFKAATRYDFYVLQKKPSSHKTIIKDQLGEITEVNLKNFGFLPNFNIKNIMRLVSMDDKDKCELGECVLYERSAYGSDKSWVSGKESSSFKYPLVHSTPKEGHRFMYSNTNDKGFFGIKKVIFGESGIYEPIIDLSGEYGMTQGAMAIVVKNKSEADKLVAFLESPFFTNILQGCMWGNFRIDWRLFTYFKKNFWDIAINNEKLLNNKKLSGGSLFKYTRKHKK
jgi:hypothetical protein